MQEHQAAHNQVAHKKVLSKTGMLLELLSRNGYGVVSCMDLYPVCRSSIHKLGRPRDPTLRNHTIHTNNHETIHKATIER